MYEKSCEIIYEKISKRIKAIKSQLQLRNEDIFPEDSNLMSAIANNRRHPKKNAYLIPNKERNSDATGMKPIDIITKNLFLPSPTYLILGSEDELERYAGYFFKTIILDAIHSEPPTTKKNIYTLLLDYIPFAQAYCYYEVLDEQGFVPEPFQKYYAYIEDLAEKQEEAIARLFSEHKDMFIMKLTEFFKEQPNTTKLNKRLSIFVRLKMLPAMLSERKPYLTSVNANEILNTSQRLLCDSIQNEITISTVNSAYYHNEINSSNPYVDDFVETNLEYVEALAKIQKKYEMVPDFIDLVDTWSPNICLKNLLCDVTSTSPKK